MNDKDQYRKRYLAIQNKLNNLMSGYDCGIALACFLNPEIEEAQLELYAIIQEIKSSDGYKKWKKV